MVLLLAPGPGSDVLCSPFAMSLLTRTQKSCDEEIQACKDAWDGPSAEEGKSGDVAGEREQQPKAGNEDEEVAAAEDKVDSSGTAAEVETADLGGEIEADDDSEGGEGGEGKPPSETASQLQLKAVLEKADNARRMALEAAAKARMAVAAAGAPQPVERAAAVPAVGAEDGISIGSSVSDIDEVPSEDTDDEETAQVEKAMEESLAECIEHLGLVPQPRPPDGLADTAAASASDAPLQPSEFWDLKKRKRAPQAAKTPPKKAAKKGTGAAEKGTGNAKKGTDKKAEEAGGRWAVEQEHPTNFSQLPDSILPPADKVTGKHSYTVYCSKSAVVVRVRDPY